MTIEELQRAYAQLEDLTKSLATHVAALATRLDRGTFQTTRIANASEEANALVLTEVQQSRAKYETLISRVDELIRLVAIVLDNVKDAENAADEAKLAVREHTGAHPLQPLDVDDTDKAIGKFVRGVVKRGWFKLATVGAGGIGVGGAIHWIIDHVFKR